ncbi:WD domain-containing protein [Thraustotheca clavata]|uniref:Serine-threonine kinase receptor-associated protein n=1 Tax=Thraustotheca clavata TaxID=74557 RepID=A0A1V9ZV78_9STRA|nr:WD domain-containing protein [Thraustotheca clavata]
MDGGARRQIPIVCPGHSRPLSEVAYCPHATPNPQAVGDHFLLISGCHDKLPMLRCGRSGNWIGTFEGHKGAVWSAKLNEDGTKAITGSGDFSAKLWDAITGDNLATYEHKHIVKSVEFIKHGAWVATGGQEKILRVYDVTSIEKSTPLFEMMCDEGIRKIVEIPDRPFVTVVTGDTAGNIVVWNVETQTRVATMSVDRAGVMDMEASRGGQILTVAAGSKVYFFDTTSWTLVFDVSMPITFTAEGGASLHPTLDRFIAGGSDTWVRVFAYEGGKGKELECHKGHHGPVRCLRYAPNGESFATGSEDGTIRVWQTDLSSVHATSVSLE